MSTEGEEFVLEKFNGIIDFTIGWLSNKTKLTKNMKSKLHLQESSFEKAFSIDDKYDQILKVLLEIPASNTKEICQQLDSNIDDNGYRKILRQVKELAKLGLIEDSLPDARYIGHMGKNTIPYELTLTGIVYIISNFGTNLFLGADPLKQLLCNYNYPYNP